MTMPKWIDPKITAGNVITLGVMIVGFFLWGARIEAQQNEHSKTMQKLEAADTILLNKIETTRDLAGSRQEAVLTRLTRIETILERLDKQASRP